MNADARRAGVRPGMTGAQAAGGGSRAAPAARDRGRPRGGRGGAGRRRVRVRAARGTRRRADLLRRRRSGPALPARECGARRPSRPTRRASGSARASPSPRRAGRRGWRRAPTSWRSFPPDRGEARAFLAPLPVTLFTDDDDLRAAFRRWGTRTAGAIAALPPQAVALRLGPAGAAVARLARAEDDEPFLPLPPPDALEEAVESRLPDRRAGPAVVRAARPGRSRAGTAGRAQPGLRRADAAPDAGSARPGRANHPPGRAHPRGQAADRAGAARFWRAARRRRR